jgi:hypothetical protein
MSRNAGEKTKNILAGTALPANGAAMNGAGPAAGKIAAYSNKTRREGSRATDKE